MHLAMIGLGRMGQNMSQRLIAGGHTLAGYDQSSDVTARARSLGIRIAENLSDLKTILSPPRIAWVMVPHGDPVRRVLTELITHFDAGDIIIDGGNSHFVETIANAKLLAQSKINFVDVGVSGGVFGLERGYCLMIGGDKKQVSYLEPIFKTLAPESSTVAPTAARTTAHSTAHDGYYHCGGHGAGHYVKMIHNAIEYGMMQSFAEGLEVLDNASRDHLAAEHRFHFDIREICELWRRGSVVSSWLLDLLSEALHKDPQLTNFSGQVPDSGEGRWALQEAITQNTPTPNLANSLFTRFRSRQLESFAEKSLSALRKEFGGHSESQGGSKK